jgi:hypothetical protein
VTQRDWTRAVDLLLEGVDGLSEREAADAHDVSPRTIGRWRLRRRKGLTVADPRGAAKDALLRILDPKGRGLERNAVLSRTRPLNLASEDQRRVTADVLSLGGPGENRPRKLEALDHCRAYMTAVRTTVPDWWYELRGRVEAGEI